MANITLKVEGKFPAKSKPDTIRIEPEKGTFALFKGDTWLANGQLVKRG